MASAAFAGPAAATVLPTTASGRYVVGATAMVRVGGTVYVGGDFSVVANRTGSAIVVPEAGGTLEPVAAEVAGGAVSAALADGSGGWYIGGSFTSVGGVPCSGLAHLRADGTLDSAFSPGDVGPARALALAGGRLYVGGIHRVTSGLAPVLVALDAKTGAALPTTYELLPVTTDNPTGVLALLASGGRLYVGFGPDGVAAYHAAGGAPIWKRTYTPVVAEAEGAGALALNGATLLVAGKFQDGGNSNIEALDVTDGAPIGPQLSVPATGVSAIAVVGGSAYLARGGADTIALVDLTTGVWRRWGTIFPATLAADGTTLYVAGRTATDLRYTDRVYSAQAGTAQPAFQPVSPPIAGPVLTAVPQNGQLLIGGAFTGAGGAVRNNLAAFDVGTGALLPWDPKADGMVDALAVAGRTIYLAGQFTHVAGVPRSGLAAVSTDGTGRVLAWHPSAPGVDALAVSGGRVFAGGSIFLAPTKPKPGAPGRRQEHLAAFSAGGAGSLLWYSPEATWNVSALAVWHSTLLAAGPSVIALPISGNGRQDLWRHSTNDSIVALAIRGTTLYAGGEFSRVDGQPRTSLAAFALDRKGTLLPFAPALPAVEALAPVGADLLVSDLAHTLGAVSETGQVEPWHIDGDGEANAIVPVSGGLVVAGGFSWLGPPGHQAAGGIAWLP